jgi:hypothetical protein
MRIRIRIQKDQRNADPCKSRPGTQAKRLFTKKWRLETRNRVVDAWNLVSNEIKNARTVTSFKNAYRKYKPSNPPKQDGDGVPGSAVPHPEPENS